MNQTKINKIEEILTKINNVISRFVYAIVPFIIMVLFLIYCNKYELYPFGNKTIAWCDMEQQVIPLLNDYKDILSQKKDFTYNLANAGGMSFFGVFFFFLASPFSFLVIFIDKADMSLFMNILVMLKMMTIGFTSSYYLYKKFPKLNVLFNISFSLLYAFSAYNLMYYQNVIWLDLVYLFPILLLSIDYLLEKDNYIFYAITILTTMIVNYYIGSMMVFFTILYIAVNLLLRHKQENIKKIALHFVVASISAAFISMIVIIPSYIDYSQSARTISLIDSIATSWVIPSYQTIIPMLLPLVIVIPFMFKKDKNPEIVSRLILLAMMCVPMLFDPINKMWHLGSYQAFPCRFTFMNIFLCLDIVAHVFAKEREEKQGKNYIFRLIGVACIIAIVAALFVFENKYVESKIGYLSKYATSLWGNDSSFEALLRYYLILLFSVTIVSIFYHLKFISKRGISIMMVGLAVLESSFAFRIYVAVPARDVTSYQDFYEIQDMIKDDSFYRVKTNEKYRNVNDLGGAGYNNLGHYTSLTNENYMYTLKSLGYSSYWMEAGSYGGTTFTDAMLLNKYTIYYGHDSSAKYYTDHYYALENNVYPMGIVTSNDLSNKTSFTQTSRAEIQEELYQGLFDDSLHTIYSDFTVSGCTYEKNEYYNFLRVGSNAKVTYNIHVNGNQKLYFECFDEYSNSLKEHINESFSISVNGINVMSQYPLQGKNGVIDLGNYKDKDVNVTIKILKDVYCKSFTLYSLDSDKLVSSIENVKSPELVLNKDKFTGTVNASKGDYLFLPLIYNSGIRAKINGKKVDVNQTYSCFSSIELIEGNNEIEIYFTQEGLGVGITLTMIGIIGFGAYIYFDKKNKIKDIKKVENCSYYVIIIGGIILTIILYILPVIINVIYQIK